MKRTLPVVLKYLAIVGISCLLAFVISHASVFALEAKQTSATAGTGEPANYVSPGSYVVETSLAVWLDGSRAREVPVKVYFPAHDSDRSHAAKFPIIFFSHGLGGSREGGKRWALHWASHGFVVLAIQHGGSDEALWKGVAPRQIEKNMKAGMTLGNLVLRAGDVHFAIDEVIRRTAAGEAAFKSADPTRLGMSGHSFGAQTTLYVSGQRPPFHMGQSALDARISAAIAFSPNARNRTSLARQFGEIKLPFFSITGSDDGSILGDGTRPADRRLPYDNMPSGQKYLAVFEGGDHMVFGGHEFGLRRPETARDKKIQRDVLAGTLAFWRTTLSHDVTAKRWLEDGGYKASIGDKDTFDQK